MPNDHSIETLEATEYNFLVKKERKERRQYNRILWILLAGSAVVSFAGAWKYVKTGNLTLFSWEHYFINVTVLMLLSAAGVWYSRHVNLKKLQSDIEERTKIVERVMITRKTFLHNTNTYFFYINSPVRMSIEVSAAYFERLGEGDEINIEYSTYSRVYFGYY